MRAVDRSLITRHSKSSPFHSFLPSGLFSSDYRAPSAIYWAICLVLFLHLLECCLHEEGDIWLSHCWIPRVQARLIAGDWLSKWTHATTVLTIIISKTEREWPEVRRYYVGCLYHKYSMVWLGWRASAWKVSGAECGFGIRHFLKCVTVANHFPSLSFNGSNLL